MIKNKGYIYKITNKINGLSYIGKSSNPVEKRWKAHVQKYVLSSKKTKLVNAFNEFGIDNFIFEIILEIDYIFQEELYVLEAEFIEKYDTFNNGYNSNKGNNRHGRASNILCGKRLDKTIEVLNRMKEGQTISVKWGDESDNFIRSCYILSSSDLIQESLDIMIKIEQSRDVIYITKYSYSKRLKEIEQVYTTNYI